MRPWLLWGLAAALVFVVVADTDRRDAPVTPGEVKEEGQRSQLGLSSTEKHKPRRPCSGCFSILRPDSEATVRKRRTLYAAVSTNRTSSHGRFTPFIQKTTKPLNTQQEGELHRQRRGLDESWKPKPTRKPFRPGSTHMFSLKPAECLQKRNLPLKVRREVTRAKPTGLGSHVPCSGCYGPLSTPKDQRQRRDVQTSQRPRPTRKPESSVRGSAETSAEGLLSARARKEDRWPAAGKRKAKAREKVASYCAGCYSNLMLRSPPAAPDEKEGQGSSKH
ncbi:uncharacterized protein LOC102385868 isoform X1 [Alligator sinensis]|uniref:Uncharacterized protein LOC102385868 isoform X1 n=1 Tax=Alligator sinensis TaxID=38654 RepID=A0A1U7S4I2_ALLSI|nr:uncharacterized protein LOC102385868 isoform X1 [Alligator sinensis]